MMSFIQKNSYEKKEDKMKADKSIFAIFTKDSYDEDVVEKFSHQYFQYSIIEIDEENEVRSVIYLKSKLNGKLIKAYDNALLMDMFE